MERYRLPPPCPCVILPHLWRFSFGVSFSAHPTNDPCHQCPQTDSVNKIIATIGLADKTLRAGPADVKTTAVVFASHLTLFLAGP